MSEAILSQENFSSTVLLAALGEPGDRADEPRTMEVAVLSRLSEKRQGLSWDKAWTTRAGSARGRQARSMATSIISFQPIKPIIALKQA